MRIYPHGYLKKESIFTHQLLISFIAAHDDLEKECFRELILLARIRFNAIWNKSCDLPGSRREALPLAEYFKINNDGKSLYEKYSNNNT